MHLPSPRPALGDWEIAKVYAYIYTSFVNFTIIGYGSDEDPDKPDHPDDPDNPARN